MKSKKIGGFYRKDIIATCFIVAFCCFVSSLIANLVHNAPAMIALIVLGYVNLIAGNILK